MLLSPYPDFLPLCPYIIPIYGSSNSKAMLIGSGVLFEVPPIYFIITAAHILDENDAKIRENPTTLYVPAKGVLRELRGESCKTDPPLNAKREDDTLDFGFIEVELTLASDIQEDRKYLTPADIDFWDFRRAGEIYTFMGYPASYNAVRRDIRRVTQNPLAYTEKHTASKEIPNGFDSKRHIVVKYHQKNIHNSFGKIHRGPKPEGMSGGAVWRTIASIYPVSPRLCGIGIEHKSAMRLLIGTRIHIIIQAMAKKYSCVARAFPKSNPSRIVLKNVSGIPKEMP